MKKWFFLVVLILTAQTWGQSQSAIFIPNEVKQAYEKGTRSMDGRPGPNYWQNHARYQMDLSVDPSAIRISGRETVVYTNNSPDQLGQLVVSLIYDQYKQGRARMSDIDPESITDGVELQALSINGTPVNMEDPSAFSRAGTQMRIQLPEALAPGGQLTMTAEWSQPIHPVDGRVGYADSTSYFVGYFYPKIAVYDDIYGWDTDSHKGQVEFYSDLADFDVRITAPASFFVWGTGVLQNPEQVLPPAMLEKYRKAGSSDDNFRIITETDVEQGLQMPGTTWHFQAERVPDFAFFTSDHYVWDAGSVEIDGRRVFISTIFPPEAEMQHSEVTDIQKEAMTFFSEEVTGIPYPYPAYASVNANLGGGMEFPMLANNGAPPTRESMASLVAHEMHHMYFPFYIRINEKKYAWMDEGWADYITDLALIRKIVGKDYEAQAEGFLNSALGTYGRLSNVPLITPAEYQNADNYFFNAYSNSHFVYRTLHGILGEETFLRCLREYMNLWKEKAPMPWDFFFTFERVSGQDLSWFWNPYFFEFGAADVAIGNVKKTKVEVRKIGRKPVPVAFSVEYDDGFVEKHDFEASVWKDNDLLTVVIGRKKGLKKILVNASLPDARLEDNIRLISTQLLSGNELDEYTGRYAVNDNLYFQLFGSGIFLQADVYFNGNKVVEVQVLPEAGSTTFAALDGQSSLQFNTDDGGQVTGVMLNFLGNMIPARKEE